MTIIPFPEQTAPPQQRRISSIELLPVYVQLSARIANTEFVPTALRNRPEAVLAALMSGAERGLGPMESLRSVHIIEGRPSLSAEAMRALVFAAGHTIEIVESNAQRAIVVGRRAGSDATSPPFMWTIDRARRARLHGRDNWVRYPEAMLLARASTDLCRALFPDVIAGLASIEEVSDMILVDEPTTTRRGPRRSMTVPAAAPGGLRAPADSTATDAAASTEPAAAPVDNIPGDDRPSWGNAPLDDEGEPPPDPGLGRRIHAQVATAFPTANTATRDRYRHALVAVVTRHRASGSVTSSADLTIDEQMVLSDALVRITSGESTVTDGPDDTVEVRGGHWLFTVTLTDPPTVTVTNTSEVEQ